MSKELPQFNPDRIEPQRDPFILRTESLPRSLQPLLDNNTFRRSTIQEIEASYPLTQNAWPGLPETTSLDLRAREMINQPMLGAFTKDGTMIGYSRLLWGFDNLGTPEIASHMTAVSSETRNGGIGEALKWQARQVALDFPKVPVEQLTVTFDNLQGRNCHVNINKLGIICGFAGGRFKNNAYATLTGEQHRGNPTDRFQGRWYLDSEWTKAHLEERIKRLSPEEVREYPTAIDYVFDEEKNLPIPKKIDLEIEEDYVALPIPLDWDSLLLADKQDSYIVANAWRSATKEVIESYHGNGYTTIAQVNDKDRKANFQIMAYNFDPFNPPKRFIM